MQDTTPAGGRLIWDLPTRVFHWALAASFAGAYLLSENDGARTLHVMFGYTVAGLVAFRLLWGFVGSPHSRFRDFAYSPAAALRYLRDLAVGRARDCDGHNPAGSWAIYALLTLAGATALAGWLTYNKVGGEMFEEAHEVLANAWLVLVLVHVAGVFVGSLAHRRNLVATMITGRRPADGEEAAATTSVRPGWVLGSALLATVLGFWTWSATTGGGSLLAGAAGGEGEHERDGQAVGGPGTEVHDDDGDEDEDDD